VSPMCGLDQGVGFLMRDGLDPRFVVMGADLTGAHILAGHSAPASYHIGGTGVMVDEALIRTFGETTERYAQVISADPSRHRMLTATWAEMAAADRPVVPEQRLRFFSPEQHATPGFPFQPFDAGATMTWISVSSLLREQYLWAPAQLVLVGYVPRREAGEPWLMPAVSTGTAAHTVPTLAMRNAILELVQIDAAMGHWYSGARAPALELDGRCDRLTRIVERTFPSGRPRPVFHRLASPDLPGHAIACVLEQHPGKLPSIGIGLGIDLRLERALYKSLLEAVGVIQLAKVTLLNRATNGDASEIEPARIFDLDSNVAYYAEAERRPQLREQFAEDERIWASELPPDHLLNPAGEVRLLLDAFSEAGLSLLGLDLTTPDIRELGFVAHRVWSPDTLPLSLPSAPPTQHSRFLAYGGAAHVAPHPYP
jgi:ribosomal protein S12 methylthiotransferase accessory factor